MNPFDLRGPEFLVFYLVLGGLVLAVVLITRHAGEAPAMHTARLADPYQIAMLRGGPVEAFLVAVVALVTRGLLDAKESLIVRRPDAEKRVGKNPLERAVIDHFEVEQSAMPPVGGKVAEACRSLEADLERVGLLPDATRRTAARSRAVVAMLVLATVALIKIAVAFGRGRHNVGFLILLAAGFAFVLWKAGSVRLTAAGQDLLVDAQRLFAGLKKRVVGSGHDAGDVTMLAAVFGVAALSPVVFPARTLLLPRKRPWTSRGNNAGTSCSSCGGGASGCGGGGGGGGCGGGGCGGCGS